MSESIQPPAGAGAAVPVPYDEAATFQIELSRLIRLNDAVPLVPRGDIFVTGAALNQIVTEHGADAVLSARRV